MSGIEYLQYVKQQAEEQSKKTLPRDMHESMQRIKEYIDSQLPITLEMDFVPYCFDVSQNQQNILIGGKYGNIAIFNINKNKMIKDIEISVHCIKSVLLAMDDSLAIVTTEIVSSYKEILFLEFPSFYQKKIIKIHAEVIDIKPGVLKNTIFILDFSFSVRILNLETWSERLLKTDHQITYLDVCDDTALIALALGNGSIQVLHGETESILQTSESYSSVIDILLFSQYHAYIAAGFRDYIIRVFNIDSDLSLKFVLNNHNGPIKGLAFLCKNKYLVSGGSDHKITVMDMRKEASPFFLELFDAPVLCFKTAENCNKLYFSQDINKLMIWKVPDIPQTSRYRRHSDIIRKVIFIPHENSLLSLGADGLGVLWDCEHHHEDEIIDFKQELITGLVSSTGKFAFISSNKPSLIRLSLSTYKFYEYSLISCARSMRLSTDENLLAIGDDLYRIIIYDSVVMEKKVTMKGHIERITDLWFVNKNSTLITCSEDTKLIKWSIKSSTKTKELIGHEAAVKCMIVTNDEEWIISGSIDNIILIWSGKYEVVLHRVVQEQSPTGILSLYLSKDKTYLIVLQESRISYWEISNLCIIFQIDIGRTGITFDISDDEKTLAVTEENTILVQHNFLKYNSIKIVGKSYGSPQKFMNYIRSLEIQNSISQYSENFNHWMITPYRIGIAHILSYSNKYEVLQTVLLRTFDKASFCSTINNENPLSISVNMDHKSCIEICLKFLKAEYSLDNTRAYMPLANCLTELTSIDIPVIPRLFDILYQQNMSGYLPEFCTSETTDLPALYYSKDIIVNLEKLLPEEFQTTHGQSIVFFSTLCPLDIELGSERSIAFLESIVDCNYPEIFRSKLLIALLRDKWDKVKKAIFIQGSLYIIYLVLLSFFCIFLRGSQWFLGVLFFFHLLLFMYEVFQIATDFTGYWFDMWNILDQLRGLSFTIYVILEWRGHINETMLLIVIIFSWTRGISYFRMFEGTRYMVRLLSEVIADMQVFFIILSYSTIAFTFIFYLKKAGPAFGMHLTVSYRLDLGDFSTSEYDHFDWVIFFFATVINPLIMLNLLISIMGNTYGRVKESNDIANFQELTEMILEIEKLMVWKKNSKLKHFLQQCLSATSLEDDEPDKINLRLKSIRTRVNNVESDLNNICEEFCSEWFDDMNAKILDLKSGSSACNDLIKSNKQIIESSAQIIIKLSQELGFND